MGYDHSIQSVRRRVVRGILRDCILPAGIVILVLRLTGVKLGYVSGAFMFPAVALSGMYLQSAYRNYANTRECSRLGAVPVPE